MLQRRRCRCCVSCIIILVVCISVFYFSSLLSGTVHADFSAYVDAKNYPDFHQYARNFGDTFGLGGILDTDGRALKEVPLRILMKEDKNADVNLSSKLSKNGITNTSRTFQPKRAIEKAQNTSDELNLPKMGEPSNKIVDKMDIKPTHIVIVTNRRSGSSFLGQIFNQNPSLFFHFEPLKVTEWKKELYPNATELVRNIFKCKFDSTPYLMDMYNRESLHRESSKVLTSPPLCDMTKIVNKLKPVKWCPPLKDQVATDVCKRYKHIAVKMIRMYSISSLKEIVQDPSLNVKVIHLVRDPRGIYISRVNAEQKVLSLGTALDKDVTYTCRRMRRNLEFIRHMPEWLEGRYVRVRYEDVAENPKWWAQNLYDFTGLGPVPRAVSRWIHANTQVTLSTDYAYSTRRNSSSTAQAWRKSVSLDIVQHMQDLCHPVLEELGYLEVTSETQLRNTSHSLVA